MLRDDVIESFFENSPPQKVAETVAEWAVHKEDYQILELYFKNPTFGTGSLTPMYVAVSDGNLDMILYLFSKKITGSGNWIVDLTAAHGHLDIIK